MANGRVIFDRPWKRTHDLQKVLLEEWGTSLRKDEFIYQAAKSASEAFKGQFGMELLPPIVQKAASCITWKQWYTRGGHPDPLIADRG